MGKRGRPNQARINIQYTLQQAQQQQFIRSARILRTRSTSSTNSKGGRKFERVSAVQLRNLVSSLITASVRERHNFLNDLKDLVEWSAKEIEKRLKVVAKQRSTKDTTPNSQRPILEFYNKRLETEFGAPRDIDGNVIYAGDSDRLYIIDTQGEKLFVRAYLTEIPNEEEQCTVTAPDGKRLVIVTEPAPSLSPRSDLHLR